MTSLPCYITAFPFRSHLERRGALCETVIAYSSLGFLMVAISCSASRGNPRFLQGKYVLYEGPIVEHVGTLVAPSATGAMRLYAVDGQAPESGDYPGGAYIELLAGGHTLKVCYKDWGLSGCAEKQFQVEAGRTYKLKPNVNFREYHDIWRGHGTEWFWNPEVVSQEDSR